MPEGVKSVLTGKMEVLQASVIIASNPKIT